MASWLVRSTLERAVRVRALAGDIMLCSWARHFTLTVPLSTQVYIPANLMLGGNPAMDQHPIQGNRDKLRPGGPHWPVCRLYLTFLQPSLQHRRALLARHAIFPGGRLCDESKRREPLFVRLSLLCLPWSLEERP